MTRIIVTIGILMLMLSACTTPQPFTGGQVHQVYLPLVVSPPPPLFGVENEDADFDALLADKYRGDFLAVSLHWGQVLRDGWSYVDAKVGGFDRPLQVQIIGAPASVTLGATCLPIPKNSWGAFADFTRETIARYPGIFAVEIMNEPDVKSPWAEWWLGCWGDTYAEGVYYGEFVSAVYSELKPEYPEITFIGGAFMRPDNEFTAGALSVMEADAASFHYYKWCGLASEYDYLYDVMRSKTDLPLWFGETGLLYGDGAPAACQYEQADYIRELFDYQGVEAVIYYTLGCRPDGHEWNNSSIWGEGCAWKPAVDAYNAR